jgi:hypothetical protein
MEHSWTSGNPLNTAKIFVAGAGTQTAALAFGGETPGTTTYSSNRRI